MGIHACTYPLFEDMLDLVYCRLDLPTHDLLMSFQRWSSHRSTRVWIWIWSEVGNPAENVCFLCASYKLRIVIGALHSSAAHTTQDQGWGLFWNVFRHNNKLWIGGCGTLHSQYIIHIISKKKKEKKTNCFEHLFFYLDELKERERERTEIITCLPTINRSLFIQHNHQQNTNEYRQAVRRKKQDTRHNG